MWLIRLIAESFMKDRCLTVAVFLYVLSHIALG